MRKLFFIVVLFILFSSFASALSTTYLMSWYSHDEGSGLNVSDSHVARLHGSNSAADNIQACKFGNCRNYTSDFTQVGLKLAYNSQLNVQNSVCAWINAKSIPTSAGIFSRNPGNIWFTQGESANVVTYYVYDGATTGYSKTMVLNMSQWYFLCGTYNQTEGKVRMYVNGYEFNQASYSNVLTSVDAETYFGRHAGSYYWDGAIDELSVWNKTLSADEVLELWNGGTGKSFADVNTTTPSVTINAINYTNSTRGVIPNINIYESTKYFLRVNATIGATCNFSQQNVTDWYDNSPSSTELNISTGSLEFQFSDAVETTLNERFDIRVCYYGGTSKNLEIYWNNNASIYKTISSGLIPPCPLYYDVFNLSGSNFQDPTNFSFRCSGCGGSNKLSLQRFQDSNMIFNRRHLNSTHPLVYNSSNGFYEFYGHYHSFFFAGNYTTVVNCNNTFSTLQSTAMPSIPNAIINGVNVDGTFNALTDNVIIQRGISYSFLGTCTGDLLSAENMTLHYQTGILIAQNNTDNLNVNITLLHQVAWYTLNLSCTTVEGNTSKTGLRFFLNDTAPPEFYVSEELDSAFSFPINYSLPIDITATDKNLFGMNVSCKLNGLPIFDWLILNLSVQEYHLNYTLNNLSSTGTLSCFVEVCDDHTEELYTLGESSIKTDSLNKEVLINDEVILKDISIYDVNKLTFTQKTDRVSYCYEYNTYDYKGVKTFKYEIPIADWALRNGKNGHFANWNTKQWQDFVPSKSTPFTVKRIYQDGDFIIVEVDSEGSTVCMESIGGLNCVNNTLVYSIVETPELFGGNASMTCSYNPTPIIRAVGDTKIEWLCNIGVMNSTDDFVCLTMLYDAYNSSYLIQVNPSLNDYKSKTTILGGGAEVQNLNRYFDEENGQVVVYFDGGLTDDIKPKKLLQGEVFCSSNYGNLASFKANFTPQYPDYSEETMFKTDLILSNYNLLVAFIILICFTGLIVWAVALFWGKRK